MFLHAVIRSATLIALGILLYSQSTGFLNFKFVNVLTQIGLGYMFVYLLLHRSLAVHLVAIAVILGATWYAFYQHTPSAKAVDDVSQYLKETSADRLLRDGGGSGEPVSLDEAVANEIGQYNDIRSHWNKHTNAAGAWDRWFLNLFPRNEKPWRGKGFWVNNGGYQTLNFIPSVATMIFGLIAGLVLISDYTPRGKLGRLLGFSVLCFACAFAMDSELIPVEISDSWSVCPIVKRIWTPGWALFSAGWTFAIMAAFYAVVDVVGLQLWTFPLAIVGMNSIAMYCMASLTTDWFGRMLGNVLRTADAVFGTSSADVVCGDGRFADIYASIAVLVMLWLVCFCMYRRKLFVRI